MHSTRDDDRGLDTPGSSVMRVARKISGTVEIDLRDGFERVVRECTENALVCFRGAYDARAEGLTVEAMQLSEIADKSLDLARAMICKIESL